MEQPVLNDNDSVELKQDFVLSLFMQLASGTAQVKAWHGYRFANTFTPPGQPDACYRLKRNYSDENAVHALETLCARLSGNIRTNHSACLVVDKHGHEWGISFNDSTTRITHGSGLEVGYW